MAQNNDNYIDGFVFPISRDGIEVYQRVATKVAEVYKEHGAVDYREFIEDDLNREGTRSFVDAAAAGEDEVVVFGWIVFDSKESRDRINAKVESDPRMADLISPLFAPAKPIFNPARMAYGGFKPFIRSRE